MTSEPETSNAILIHADLPGVAPGDVTVTVDGDRLVVTGSRDEVRGDRGETLYVNEREQGPFFRTFNLPAGADPSKVRASLEDGVLTVTIARRSGAQGRTVIELGSRLRGRLDAVSRPLRRGWRRIRERLGVGQR